MVYISRLSPKFLSDTPSYRSAMSSVSKTRKYWTPEEDHILRQEALSQCISTSTLHQIENLTLWLIKLAVKASRIVKDWNGIASKLPGRSNKDCRKRWCKVGANVNKGLWSPDEDDRLRKAVEEHGYS
jgi:myb-related protein